MEPILPFWFKQRQGKLEPAGENVFKAVAPQQGEAYLLIRPGDNGRWAAAVRQQPDGEDLAATAAECPRPGEAWDAAFEVYRLLEIVWTQSQCRHVPAREGEAPAEPRAHGSAGASPSRFCSGFLLPHCPHQSLARRQELL